MLVLKFTYQIGVLLYFFLFVNITKVEEIALMLVISSLIPLLINFSLIIITLLKIESTEEEKLTLPEFLKEIYKYGTILSIVSLMRIISNEVRTQTIGLYESPEIVTGYHIGDSYNRAPADATLALNKPLMISFTNLYTNNKKDQIEKIYTVTIIYSLFLILLITGIFFFFVDFFLSFFYGSSYLIFSNLVKLMLFSIVFSLLCSYLYNLLRATKNIKTVLLISFLTIVTLIISFIAGLIYYGIFGAIISVIIVNLIRSMICISLTYKIFNIKLDIRKIVLIYTAFFISIGLTIFFDFLILNDIHIWMFEELNLIAFQYLKILSIIIFLIVFLSLTIIFKIFSGSDIENIEAVFTKDNVMQKIIRKSLNILRKFLPKSKD